MIKTLLLIFDPMATWEGVFRARRSTAFILVTFLLPLLLLISVVEGYGLVHWGKWQDAIGRLKKFPVQEALVVEVVQILVSLFVVFVVACFLKSIGETFHGRHSYSQAFTTLAYSLSPLFLFRLLDAFTWVNPWVSWSIGIILSLTVLYHGVPRMMEPDPADAFGLYLMSALLLVLITGLVRFLTVACFLGKLPKLQAIVSNIAARLPF
jgi:hypothetical protein